MPNPVPADARAILITGCSSGIGLACARGLQRRGYRVFATARRNQDVARLGAEGLEALQLDVDDSTSIRCAVDRVLTTTGGRLYALFNNAGFGQPGAVEDLPREAVRAQFETNLFGALETTQCVLPAMRAAGEGRIIQNSSVLGLIALRLRGAYNASKYALEGLSDTLRLELHGSNIFVSLIEPGPIESRFRANALAAFDRHLSHRVAASVHRSAYAAARRRLEVEESGNRFTLAPEAVLRKLVHALESRRPKTRYAVTTPTYLFAGLRRLLPTRVLDAVLRSVD